jgi:hypothetical protein
MHEDCDMCKIIRRCAWVLGIGIIVLIAVILYLETYRP